MCVQCTRREFLEAGVVAGGVVGAVTLAGAAGAAAPAVAGPVTQSGDAWVIENPRLRVTLLPAEGRYEVRDLRAGWDWRQPRASAQRWSDVRRVADGVRFTTELWAHDGKPHRAIVTMRVPGGSADLTITCDLPNRSARSDTLSFLEPLALDTPDAVMAVADYSNGHLYPIDMQPFRREWLAADRLNMPWVGICDLQLGMGYALIVETSDDAAVHMPAHRAADGRTCRAPRMLWLPSKGAFGYRRAMRYRFTPNGGYVAIAKAYRAYAWERGLLVTLAQKARRNPNVARLFGAVDVWGDASLRFAREANSAGVDRMLIHGRSTPAEMRQVNALGFLTSEYDNYTDILPVPDGGTVDSRHDRLPEAAVLQADGQRMKAWLTFDRQRQYMKRCPALWAPTADQVVARVLAEWPFLGRFVDVTTAEALYECYDPAHPLTRADKRRAGERLLSVIRSRGLVVGGEHGIWWAVRHLDYIEGMMSVYEFSWPAGHLIRPESKTDRFTDPGGSQLPPWEEYERWGIGHTHRAPLWELVFHDCVVSTWYWGDSNDFLLQAAPEVQDKKDAFNILYGTMPMLWAVPEGSWRQDRERFLRTVSVTSALHRAVATAEMLDHTFLTADRALQRTRFAGGTTVVVNFGSAPRTVAHRGRRVTLPQNGFAVDGPRIEQTRALVGDRVVTTIVSPSAYYSDAEGRRLWLQREGNRLLAQVAGGAGRMRLPVHLAGWTQPARATRAFALGPEGERLRQLELRPAADGTVELLDAASADRIELVAGPLAAAANLRVLGRDVSVRDTGGRLEVSASVRNGGGRGARGAAVRLYADAAIPERLLATARASVPAGAVTAVAFAVPAQGLDAVRSLLVRVEPPAASGDLCAADNEAAVRVRLSPPARGWAGARTFRVEAGEHERSREVVSAIVQLPGIDPHSVRLEELDTAGRRARLVPVQCDRLGGDRFEVSFLLADRLRAGASRRYRLRWMRRGSGRWLPAAGAHWRPSEGVVEAAGYRLRLSQGILESVAARAADGAFGEPFMATMMFSSAETGWTEEPGEVLEQRTVRAGPALAEVRVAKRLRGGIRVDRTYTFTAGDRFDVETRSSLRAGVFARSYYLRSAAYLDSGGASATVDGRGDAEDVLGRTQQPTWYALAAPDWAHSAIALTPADAITYWDSSAWGGIGFTSGRAETQRVAFVVRPGARHPSFGAADRARAMNPPRVVWE
ncbi:MAG TPA: glycoside hydrolase [Chthonomonadales bacterium]|nr:glycoside hydrolase [Chthonomonadales bacterium]